MTSSHNPTVDEERRALVDDIYIMAITGVTKDKADALIQAHITAAQTELLDSLESGSFTQGGTRYIFASAIEAHRTKLTGEDR